jgi:biopolymer transport protein TolR
MAVTATGRRIRKRKLKAEINVVPYIDVMLVLLIIFMVTAPLLNLGVDIDLPQSNAKAVHADKDPIMVIVRADGAYELKAEGPLETVTAETLMAKVGAFHRQNPDVSVLVSGEATASYQKIMDGIDLLRSAGVDKVSLVTDPRQGPK